MDCCYRCGGTAVLHRPTAAPVDYMDSIHIISAAKTPRGGSTKPGTTRNNRTYQREEKSRAPNPKTFLLGLVAAVAGRREFLPS